MSRAAVAFPGHGSYTRSSLGSLPPDHGWVRHADELRAGYGLPPLSELDGADRFEPSVHMRAANAAPLTFLCGLLDAERIADDHEVVVVVASSSGWATALAASGALGFDDAFRLVQELSLLADERFPPTGHGGQVIYPTTDDEWRMDPDRRAALVAALAEANGEAHPSIELGSFTIIGASEAGVDRLLHALPPVVLGGRTFPMRLALQAPWHTPLAADAAALAAERLSGLTWERPNVTLVDGGGRRFTPWSTDPAELERATLGEHIVSTWDFARSMRVALREYAPDVVLLAGPGSSLGAPCAQLIVAEGYRGIRSRAELDAVQAGERPILLSMRR